MDIFCKIKTKKNQFILSFVSAIIYQVGFTIITGTCNFTVYFLSYIRYKQTWVDMNYGNLMRPVILMFLAAFSPLSGVVERLYGPRISLLISSIIVEIGFILLYFQRNIWFFYSLTLLLGIGNGLSRNILIKNSCYFYPQKKGLISSLIDSFGSLSGSFYSFLGEKVINPDRETIIDPKNQPYYAESIAERSKLFFLFAMILIPVSITISIFILYKYDQSCETDKENESDGKDEIKGSLVRDTNKGGDQNAPNTNIVQTSKKPSHKGNVKKALKNWRFWRNLLIVGAMPYIIWFEGSKSRPYCSMLGVNGQILGILTGTMDILSCVTNPIWAFFVDKFGFRPIMIIISSLTIVLSIYFFIFMDNKYFYVVGLYFVTVLRGGILSALTPHLMQIFGLGHFLIIGGLGRMLTQLFSFSAAALSIVISIFKKSADELLFPYRVVSLVGTALAIFGLILVFYENDEKFKFDDEEEKDKNEEKDDNIEENEEKKENNEDNNEEKIELKKSNE